ncbi:MAG: type I phosphomannose isomerase catalytic subunit [Phycisphaerae bacterium]|nr:class I mannose-6-phosphate isomerase [Phycisphaerales bacterium]
MADTMKPCPLIFKPIFKPRIWGGRKIHTRFDKPLPPGENFGESWELADLEDDQSVVASGPQQGRTLRELVVEWGDQLLGGIALFEGRFPLLIKYLDAREHLSVQVHPDAKLAAQLGGAVRVKNEAWVVIDAEPDGCIYRGLVDSVTPDQFSKALSDGGVEKLLKRIPVRPGDAYYLPSGTVHALGGGVLVAEVQTPSDTTYRVYDWDRVDAATGKPRELHIDRAMQCINFGDQTIEGEERSHVASVWTTITRLVTCESFIIERVRMVEGLDQDIPYKQLVVWMVLEGRATITWDKGQSRLDVGKGDTVLIPAGANDCRLQTETDCVWLEVTVPGSAQFE